MKTLCFDLDGTLCTQVEGDYNLAEPHQEAIDRVNHLYNLGYRIIIHTARFMGRANNNPIEAHKIGYDFTVKQLKAWGVQYHELHMGKPRYDLVVDDRSLFYDSNWSSGLLFDQLKDVVYRDA